MPVKVRPLKMRVILIMTLSILFIGFTDALKNLREWYH